ncbi:signal-induced proliferation-associated 1-like protein 1 isoform X1 [Pangasianodon hypophthalmus]|uniref:signal-induced proliferation-associated 1-like protein 1 isoform X1 n=1 Tax=Pangasianodon hypophthalmus TaxID=310915 RepID=UPI002307EB6C|nr:signal-induced proliferation-associated 1-like protein 1 isoform X1 [Pangasianodon hypophthalmus]XP_053097976.1 signal-induced proliferation-associated 1-like protein 1 isoform X1 [Pangasianodon hypophthalmus]XP_053097977.1 signal-induced proliferation-associated 1-like protein 1 isoform X1 [Pangasianodon hypophthalmus]XP_053097978.1 signal-induced proliferation-associated 1-like protein 1 isoform X1 [Pangasianodon hypophthalmus]XP_053097979.1 signal-induced proliferation-associated 1-like p
MTSLKRSQTERSVGGSVPATDEFYTRRLRLPNGGAPPPRSESTHLSGGTPGVPKMGVRARVADWPPRKDGGGGGGGGSGSGGSGSSSGSGSGGGGGGGVWHITVETDSPSTTSGSTQSNLSAKLGHLISPQDSSMLRNIQNTLKNKIQSKGKDNRFLSPDGYLGSPRKGMRRIRQRSNSDITISELDGDGNEGWSFSGWTPMHREYGSTSSIDKHGVSGESFFDMLKAYQTDDPDQRSPAPEKLSELLTVAHKQTALDLPDGPLGPPRGSPASRLKEREKHLKRRSKSETGGESIFRKLRSVKAEGDSSRAGSDAEDGKSEDTGPPPKPWVCQKGFAHYDVQSILFDLNEVVQNRQSASKRKNTTTGASAAAAASASTSSSLSSTQSGAYGSPCGSQEELNAKDGPALDPGDDKSNDLVLSCPCFRNEIGGEGERNISPSKQGSIGSRSANSSRDEDGSREAAPSTHFSNAGVAVLEAPKDGKSIHHERGKSNILEHVDLGAYYYRKYFYLREHWNYLGVDETLGPVAVSLRREKLDDHKEHGPQYNYRVIFRTSELMTLRGSILEDAVPSTSKHGLARGLPLKEVLEYLVPELNAHCLRLALNTPKVTEQLMKLDEQGLSFQLKVGVMYCLAGQSSEEEMYNNEAAGPALEEFLQLLGERVRLKGFSKYRAQLDTKTDSTGTHSLYTTYKDYEIMFHVSTMLPYTPNNKQQLLRKRHIGNDIVTIVFQEPGAKAFSPKNIRSHFQHVFVVVQVHNPCSENTCYSVAVARSRDVPAFGPPIPEDVKFPKSSVFRDFLLTKVINAENAAHKSDKFRAMATRTRHEYLRDLAERHVTSTPIDPSGKFPFISLAHKRKEKSRPYSGAELRSPGSITWAVYTEDHSAGGELEALLAISNDFLILVDPEAKAAVFNCAVCDVIGWTLGSPASMKIFYERGESISLRSVNNNTEDFREVVKRLEFLTKGCETSEMTLRRNGLGQLGFHVNYEGIVAEVEPYGYAWQAGLRQGSRLVEICKVAVATLSHEQMIDLLRTSVTVKVVIIPPHEDATPRRGCSELYRMPVAEYKGSNESGSFEYKFPFRSNNNKWQRTSSSPQQSLSASPQSHTGTPNRAVSLGASMGKTLSAERPERAAAIPRSVSSDGRPLDSKRMSPGSENYALASSMAMARPTHTRSSPSNLSCSSDTGSGSSAHWRQKSMPEGFAPNRHSPLPPERQMMGDGSGKSTPSWPRVDDSERAAADAPVSKSGPSYSGGPRIQRQEQVIHLSPKKSSQSEGPYSHSSSNTLSSTASSGAHSDDKWYDLGGGGQGDVADSEPNGLGGGGYLQGSSADSGIDATSYVPHHGSASSLLAVGTSAPRERVASPWHGPSEGGRRVLERSPPAAESPVAPAEAPTTRSPPTHLLMRDSSSYSLSDMASHSSSRHSGSPGVLSSSHNSPRDESPSATSPSSSSQSSVSPGPKSFYPRQGATSKYLIGWRKPGSTINSVDFGDTRKRPQGEGGVDGGPSQTRPSLRDLHSPQPLGKSTVEEDLKKLITLDSPPAIHHDDKSLQPSCSGASGTGRRSLQRTLSDESIYRGQRLPSLGDAVLEQALASDVLFSCSTLPRSPTTRGAPLRRPSYKLGIKMHGDLSASDTSLADLHERQRLPSPELGLMPLPDTDTDSGLDWSHLVDAANAFEGEGRPPRIQRSFMFSSQDISHRGESAVSSQQLELQPVPHSRLSPSDIPVGFAGKVSQLEAMVKMLQDDLKKEREEKLKLQAQIKRLWEDNQRLQEESQNSAAKLKKFTEWVFNTIDLN